MTKLFRSADARDGWSAARGHGHVVGVRADAAPSAKPAAQPAPQPAAQDWRRRKMATERENAAARQVIPLQVQVVISKFQG